MTSFSADRNIVITGFMGTGKTTIGRLLAERLDRPFVDMDETIEAHFGKPISRIFAEDGEPAFRVYEAQLCQHAASERGIVISTGGGALVNPANRQALAASGLLICLTASVDEIVARLETMTDRPLLPEDANEKRHRIRELLHARRQAYAAIPRQTDTTAQTPAQVVERILEGLDAEMEAPGMNRLAVSSPSGAYDICIGEGLLAMAGVLMRNRDLRPGPVAVVSHKTIAAHYYDALQASLAKSGYEPALCLIPDGEQHKRLDAISTLYDQFLAAQLDRNGAVIALGGGVAGDMAGFAAATYLRGTPFVQIPTSLLAMVDASVGGKTGVDLPQGKNLVGAFKQPHLVIIDPDVLATLPSAEFRSGLAEVIKHGIIGAPDLFSELEDYGPTSMAHLIANAVRVKIAVVEQDPFERDRRAVLNLGHTFGHAIEQVSGYTVRHGEGVALGIVAAARLSQSLGTCTSALASRIANVIERHDLPIRLRGYSSEAIVAAMAYDKKRSAKTLRFVIPKDIGDVVVIDGPGGDFVRQAVNAIIED